MRIAFTGLVTFRGGNKYVDAFMAEPQTICEMLEAEGHEVCQHTSAQGIDANSFKGYDAILLPSQLSLQWQEQVYGSRKDGTQRVLDAIIECNKQVYYICNDPRPRFLDVLDELSALLQRGNKQITVFTSGYNQLIEARGYGQKVLPYQLLSGLDFPYAFQHKHEPNSFVRDMLVLGSQMSKERVHKLKAWTKGLEAHGWGITGAAVPSITKNWLNADTESMHEAMSLSALSMFMLTDEHIASDQLFTTRWWQVLTWGSCMVMEAELFSKCQRNKQWGHMFTKARRDAFAVQAPCQLPIRAEAIRNNKSYYTYLQEMQKQWYIELMHVAYKMQNELQYSVLLDR